MVLVIAWCGSRVGLKRVRAGISPEELANADIIRSNQGQYGFCGKFHARGLELDRSEIFPVLNSEHTSPARISREQVSPQD